MLWILPVAYAAIVFIKKLNEYSLKAKGFPAMESLFFVFKYIGVWAAFCTKKLKLLWFR